ncbi:hypothetical protein R5R35_008087 [Gryllus longicercus]|uniref:Uncharacterized protein n=1 Tax=Gryllus longicercus TaxID=2509291 RepID=A0AAN9VB09_9ORTH
MGTCMGRCFNIKNSRRLSYLRSLVKKKPSQEVILELTADLVPQTDESPYEEVEFTHLGHKSYADQPVQFHCLSRVQAKPTHSVARDRSDASFTPPSSLDLEWEHEGGLLQFAPVPEEDPDKISSSDSHCPINSDDWSRISSPDSLEWDPVEAPLTSTASRSTGLDPATEMLLKRIEHLESSTLRETGDWKR